MNFYSKIAPILAGAALGFAHPANAAPDQPTPKIQAAKTVSGPKPHIDIVFLIDCSGSMGPVIDTAKRKIWEIVNQVAKAKPSPVLRIGLYAYGNGENSIRSYPLSDDLDTVYERLLSFKDEGWSAEYVGLLVHKADEEMQWTPKAAGVPSLQTIYVVGNETALQGPMRYNETTASAAKKGIVVNAMYCGNSGGQETWREMAKIGNGDYLEVAASGGSVTIPTPFDDELAKLNGQLNGTYLAYGARGAEGAANQAAQDRNSTAVGGTANLAARAQAKSSAQYSNYRWDLVDAIKDKKIDLDKVKTEELPAEMQKMTPAERTAFVAKKSAEREALNKKIGEIAKKREAYIKIEIEKKGLNQDNALDAELKRSVVNGAKAGGFYF